MSTVSVSLLLFIVFSLLTLTSSKYVVRLVIQVDNDTFNNFMGKDEAFVGRKLQRVNNLLRDADVHIQWTGLEVIPFPQTYHNRPFHANNVFQVWDWTKSQRSSISGNERITIRQMWTAVNFDNRTLIPDHRTNHAEYCTGVALLPLVVNGEPVDKKAITKSIIHSILQSLGVLGRGGACMCPDPSTCYPPNRTGKRKSEEYYPLCVKQMIEDKTSHSTSRCIDLPANPLFSRVAICKNGVVEGPEECDCFRYKRSCWSCCYANCTKRTPCVTGDVEDPDDDLDAELPAITILVPTTTRPENESGSGVAIAVSVIVVILLLIILIVIGRYVVKKRRNKNNPPVPVTATAPEVQSTGVSVTKAVSKESFVIKNPFRKKKAVPNRINKVPDVA